MGWFDRKPKWDGAAVLERAARLAGVSEPVVTELQMTGHLHDFPVEIAVDEDGSLQRIALTHAPLPDRLELVADIDPDVGEERRVEVGEGVFVEGAHADRQAAAFGALPQVLRVRAIAEIHRLQITELTSERKRLAIELREEPHRVAEPARWLADVLVLGADLALARGAHPSHGPPPPGLAAQLAAKLAARIPGATMARSDDNLAVVWSDARIGLGNDVVTIELRGAASEELDELFALHELRSMTHDGDQLAFEVCDLDEVTDDGAAAYRIASDLIRVVRPR